jgi:putative Ca2+/H+ antiporter (TMEM165/GDT1 family)
MEALVPAFIAALLCQATDRSAWLTAILADRYRKPLRVLFAALIANTAGNCIAALGAQWIAPALTPEARGLLLALALIAAGADGLWPRRAPERLENWRLGAWLTPLLGLLILISGDRTQFLTLALGVRAQVPGMAAAGAIAGAVVVHAAAGFSGEVRWLSLPLLGLRIVSGIVALIAGAVIGLSALRLT